MVPVCQASRISTTRSTPAQLRHGRPALHVRTVRPCLRIYQVMYYISACTGQLRALKYYFALKSVYSCLFSFPQESVNLHVGNLLCCGNEIYFSCDVPVYTLKIKCKDKLGLHLSPQPSGCTRVCVWVKWYKFGHYLQIRAHNYSGWRREQRIFNICARKVTCFLITIQLKHAFYTLVLALGEEPGTRCVGWWVASRNGLDVVGKSEVLAVQNAMATITYS
jgi:hypothetical protein